MNLPSVSAIVACYKDGEAIPEMYQRLTTSLGQLGCEYEIIFVDDSSPDDSWAIIQEISRTDSAVVGINHSRNFGSQFAFRSGMEISSMDSVVLLDGDLQDPPEVIPELYSAFCAGADIVYGVRAKREMSRFRESFYKVFYWLFSGLSEYPIPRNAGDFSVLSRRVVRLILEFPERDFFFRSLRAYVGFHQVGIEYFRPERAFGRSTNSLGKNINWARKAIFSSSTKPLRFVTNFGFWVSMLAILLAIWFVLLRVLFPENSAPGMTLLSLLILGLGGIQLLALGVIGEYVGRILEEAKQRPAPIRNSIIRAGIEEPEVR